MEHIQGIVGDPGHQQEPFRLEGSVKLSDKDIKAAEW